MRCFSPRNQEEEIFGEPHRSVTSEVMNNISQTIFYEGHHIYIFHINAYSLFC